MKEIEEKRKDETKIVSEKQIEKQLRFMGNVFVRPNQKCYEYNMLNKELQIAKTECIINPFATGKKIDIYNGGTTGESKFEQKVITKDDCLYVVDINERNAKRKLGI